MIIESFYLSPLKNLDKAIRITGLSEDEILTVVGKFKNDHYAYPNCFKGEVLKILDKKSENGYNVIIRHHFTKKVLWRKNLD